MIRYMPQMFTIGENMHADPGVESGQPKSYHYTGYWSCPFAVDAVDRHSGSFSVKYTRDADPSLNRRQGAICYAMRIVSGGTYQASAWIKAIPSEEFYFSVRLMTSDAVAQTEGAGAVRFFPTGNWQYVETSVFALSPNKPYYFGIIANNYVAGPIGVSFNIDDLRIWRVA